MELNTIDNNNFVLKVSKILITLNTEWEEHLFLMSASCCGNVQQL